MKLYIAQDPTLQTFENDIWWIALIKVLGVFVLLLLLTLFTINYERKVVARMAVRPGPNQVGPKGWLQSLTDGLKLPFKEEIIPRTADKVIYFIAPVISATCAFTAFAVIPFGPMVSIFGQQTALQVTGCAGVGAGGAGLLVAGHLRRGAGRLGVRVDVPAARRPAVQCQMISYEVAMGLSIVAVFMMSGSMSTSEIVAAQGSGREVSLLGIDFTAPGWYAILLAPSFIIYAISAVGETNRAPFDLPEAESELVGGFHTEYSSFKFALFFLAEYINMITVSALCTTLFLGGWHATWPITLWSGANTGWWPMLWFLAKVLLCLFVFIWLRATLPRMRYDQFMRFGWKVLIPVNLVWILLLATVRVLQTSDLEAQTRFTLIGGAVLVVVLIAVLWPSGKKAAVPSLADQVSARPQGSFPLPPLDLQVPPSPRAARQVAERQPADVSSDRSEV